MFRKIVLILIFTVFCIGPNDLVAKEPDDTIAKINKALDNVAYRIKDLDRKSIRQLEEARREAKRLPGLVDGLRKFRKRSKAKQIVERYPRYLNDLRNALGHLQVLKQLQQSVSKFKPWCVTRDHEIKKQVIEYVRRKDPKGLGEIPKLAEDMQKQVVERLDKGRRIREMVQSRSNRVRQFSVSVGKWSLVRREMYESTKNIKDYWQKEWEAAQKSCKELKRGIRHRSVAEGLSLPKTRVH